MKFIKKTYFLALFLFVWLDSSKASSSLFDDFNTFFSTHVDNNGLVNYKALKTDSELMNLLVQRIADHNLSNASTSYRKAFYTNAYNLLVIKQLTDNYPVKGPMAIPGFFDKTTYQVAGEKLTLNQIEKDKNLKPTGDERLHFALVCGAMGCPPLANYAFTPENIESQLEDRTQIALNNQDFIKDKNGKLAVSQIFYWYSADFKNKSDNGLLGYINKYRKNKTPRGTKVVYYSYNWELNSQ